MDQSTTVQTNKLRTVGAVLAATMLMSTSVVQAQGQGLSYDYIQGNYGRFDFDGSGQSSDGDGFGIGGMIGLNENIHLFGDYQTADLDFGVDLSILEFGVGYHTTISPNLDFLANLGFTNIEADTGIGTADEDGFTLGVGLRTEIAPQFELFGNLDYVDFDSDSDTRAKIGALYDLTDAFSIGLTGTFYDNVDILQLNGRYYFY